MQATEGGTTTLHASMAFQRPFFPMNLQSLLANQRYNALGRVASGLHPAFLPVPAPGIVCPRPGQGVGSHHVPALGGLQPNSTAGAPDSVLPAFPGSTASSRSGRDPNTVNNSFTIDAILGATDAKAAVEGHFRGRQMGGSRYQPYSLDHRPGAPRKDTGNPLQACVSHDLTVYARDYNTVDQKGTQSDRKSSSGNDLSPLPWKQSKSKRVRTIFTPEQLERLEAEFERQQYMVGTERYYLAASLNLTEGQVKVWFQNRRIKWRKHSLEMQQAKMASRSDMFLANEEQAEPEQDRELIASNEQIPQTPEKESSREDCVEYSDIMVQRSSVLNYTSQDGIDSQSADYAEETITNEAVNI